MIGITAQSRKSSERQKSSGKSGKAMAGGGGEGKPGMSASSSNSIGEAAGIACEALAYVLYDK